MAVALLITCSLGFVPYGKKRESATYIIASRGNRFFSSRTTASPPTPESNTPLLAEVLDNGVLDTLGRLLLERVLAQKTFLFTIADKCALHQGSRHGIDVGHQVQRCFLRPSIHSSQGRNEMLLDKRGKDLRLVRPIANFGTSD